MAEPRNIFLVGLMGAGKTTVGRQLARTLAIDFYDSDREIESRTGVDIPLIFEYEGEAGFRKREQSMIEELTQSKEIVLATGGGTVLSTKNRENLKNRGFVVYLKCSIDCLLQRTHNDRHRPLLDTDNPREILNELMLIREPLYLDCADYIIDTGKWPTRHVVKDILKVISAGR